MRRFVFCTIVLFILGHQYAFGQCDNIIPPSVKKIQYATREVTFTNVKLNGRATTYLAVRPGESIDISLNVESRKNGDYCPACIVQIYWGIRGHASVCANSFYGYKFNRKKSSLKFNAPLKDGIYYVTMSATLDYSCKNNKLRPECSEDKAFAVIKVGNPDPEKKITLTKVQKGSRPFLNTTLVKSGCYGELDRIEWFLDGEKLTFDNQKEISLAKYGKYKVVWSNCLANTSMEYNHSLNNQDSEIKKAQSTPESYTGQVKRYNQRPTATQPNDQVRSLDLQTSSDQSMKTEPSSIDSNTSSSSQDTYEGNMTFTRVSKSDVSDVNTETSEGSVGVTAPDLEQLEENDLAQLIENNDRFVLEHLIFDLGKANLLPEAKMELDKLADVMKAQPAMKIRLEGHTDRRGGAKKNKILSEKRVESAKKYLVKTGIAKSRVETKGWGDAKPIVISANVEEGKVNRRVEIQVLER